MQWIDRDDDIRTVTVSQTGWPRLAARGRRFATTSEIDDLRSIANYEVSALGSAGLVPAHAPPTRDA